MQAFQYKLSYGIKKVFRDREEEHLLNCVKTVTKMQFSSFLKGSMEDTEQFAVANISNVQDKSNEQRFTGEEWIRCLCSGTHIFVLCNPSV